LLSFLWQHKKIQSYIFADKTDLQMLKRFTAPMQPSRGLNIWHAMRFCALSLAKDQRDTLTKQLTLVREEAKGQSLDLSDMAEASRGVAKQLQDGLKGLQVDDAKFKGKTATLNASLKAYHARLSNLQSEARAIQGEIDGILKLMWGTDAVSQGSGAAASASGTISAKKAVPSDFDCDVPPIAQRLEHMNQEQPHVSSPKTPTAKAPKASEVVEGEVIRSSDKPQIKKPVVDAPPSDEIEVESIDIEIEDEGSSSTASAASPADQMSITDITKDLYERGVNFSDCLDAKSLRQRYRDVLSGKVESKAQSPPKAAASSQQYNTTQQPPPPPRPQYHQQQYQQQSTPNTTETNIAHDPYPNAHRKMIDPMKYVWEVKQELAKEKNIDPNSVDLWSGKHKLEDHKRLYDYPSIQSYPIEVRQKGDSPR
jgi:hypothetical protein